MSRAYKVFNYSRILQNSHRLILLYCKNKTLVIKTIVENERDYILYILKKCNEKVSGSGGAAEILDINPSTLN
jgi:hypothetical protein